MNTTTHPGPYVRTRELDDLLRKSGDNPCAACGAPCPGGYSIHRDGFSEGPEVPLCYECGAYERPACEDLWASIAARLIGQRLSFADAPCMRLLRHDTQVDSPLREAAGVSVWTRYLVRVPDRRDGRRIDRTALVWPGPTNEWRTIAPTIAWLPPRDDDGGPSLLVVSGPIHETITIAEMQAIAGAAP